MNADALPGDVVAGGTPDTAQAESLRGLMDEWWQPPAELLGTLPGRGGGPSLTYLGHADTTRALIETDPFWTWEPMAYTDQGHPVVDVDDQGRAVGLWGWMTVCGVRRPCYGSCKPGEQDAVKILIGDLIRNGAMRFGCGTGLWSRAERAEMGPVLVTDDQRRDLARLAGELSLTAAQASAIIERVGGVADSAHLSADKLGAVRAEFSAVAKAQGESAADALAREFQAEAV